MKCKTVKYVKKDGVPVIVNKKKYQTLVEAECNARLINNKAKTLTKRVSYKCPECSFFHVGTSLKSLNKPVKTKPRLFGGSFKLPKIVGLIDLSIFNKVAKPKEVPVIKTPVQKKTIGIGGLYINGLVWKYEVKLKIVKIFSPSGQIYKPTMVKIFGDEEKTSNAIKRYIKSEMIKIKT